MKDLVNIISKLYDVFSTVGAAAINLPQIVVIGSQSAGKSSVLESIVGRDFLPRGIGIVTRRPLIISLVCYDENRPLPYDAKRPNDLKKVVEWATFTHAKNEIFSDFEMVKEEIVKETDRLSPKQSICMEPIHLTVYSPFVAPLTLVDLPGMTKVPVGDQPHDIEEQIQKLVLKYISNPDSIILAVSAANADLSTSEAIKLAQRVDKKGDRTLAVLTKLDLMDHGTDATDILLGRIINVRLGIIGVVGRSQADIKAGKTHANVVADENRFLQRKYPSLAARSGSQYLVKRLSRLLHEHLKNRLPDLKNRIMSMKGEFRQLHQSLGEPIQDKGRIVLNFITEFTNNYCRTIDGTNVAIDEVCGGARICYVFHTLLPNALKGVDPLQGLSTDDILTAIRNANGPRPPLFVPEIAFVLLAKRQIANLEEPAVRCVDLVHTELCRMVHQFNAFRQFVRFPSLKTQLVEQVAQLLSKRLPITNEMVKNLIGIELAYINTKHPDFIPSVERVYRRSRTQDVRFGASTSRYGKMNDDSRKKERKKYLNSEERRNETRKDIKKDGAWSYSLFKGMKWNGDTMETTFNDIQKTETNNDGMGDNKMSKSSNNINELKDSNSISDNPNNVNKNGIKSEKLENHLNKNNNNNKNDNNNEEEEEENVDDDDYVDDDSGMCHDNDQCDDLLINVNDRRDCEIIRTLIKSYFNIIRKQVQDSVPKAIMHFLVNYVKENLQAELVSSLYQTEKLNELVVESEEVTARRDEAEKMLNALTKASDIINQIRDVQL
ncbi:hypothetical protein SNEBB_007763 [Seison nebaliae]|nr:hypothetical protein SNEBB_007763 [Seison nebaliae]